MNEKYQKQFFCVIAGNIGVGKTTFTRYLCSRLQWHPFYENFQENPYLKSFYTDMHRWAFHSQVFFLKERLKNLEQISQIKMPCVQDRSIYEDAEIFARNLYERQMMSERDYNVYHDLYSRISSFLPQPDLLIYLRASTWTLISRIRKRGREFEQDIDVEYLMQLNTLYEKWVKNFSAQCDTLIIDTDSVNMYENQPWMDGIIHAIEEKVINKKPL
ncbi:MAG: deoxynucleoside kinase [Deferribacteres bacterium]|nr:deoxynucleoside kinase [candidate division KSB1 bacterium]MCB9503037.1 deoxynucleoside kinase [Deferribacteres bacterium]